MPKKSFLSEYSSRVTPQKVARLLAGWHAQLAGETLLAGQSFNLDFHSVPYFGTHPLVESHYVSQRSRRPPSTLTFLAQDAESQVFCYSNADLRKGEEAEAIFRFIEFWTRQHGRPPPQLVFDSKLTTYAGLDRLDQAQIVFLTLRRRTARLLAEIDQLPPSAWRRITLEVPHRKYRTPRIYEQKVRPRQRTYRQFFINDLGPEEPTILRSNDVHATVRQLVTRYAHRACARRCRALLPYRCPIVLGRLQGRLRHGAACVGQRSLPLDGPPHARLRRGSGTPNLPRLGRHGG
jgi:hypothetical protein